MHLKSLDIMGFKSFPDKVKMSFAVEVASLRNPRDKMNIVSASRRVVAAANIAVAIKSPSPILPNKYKP